MGLALILLFEASMRLHVARDLDEKSSGPPFLLIEEQKLIFEKEETFCHERLLIFGPSHTLLLRFLRARRWNTKAAATLNNILAHYIGTAMLKKLLQ